MFTGIVQECVAVAKVVSKPGLTSFQLPLPGVLSEGLAIGASVAVDGVCLTVTQIEGESAWFDAVDETLQKTTLGALQTGRRVNVERSMKAGTEIGGHLLSGHVSTTATIAAITETENNVVMTFQVDPSWMKYILAKGYVALDGASLTIVDVDPIRGHFTVTLIPETRRVTTFGFRREGDKINVELDAQTQAIVNTVEGFLESRLESMIQAAINGKRA